VDDAAHQGSVVEVVELVLLDDDDVVDVAVGSTQGAIVSA
jgi:hypothetical protein